jgi:general secretion pathway protein H
MSVATDPARTMRQSAVRPHQGLSLWKRSAQQGFESSRRSAQKGFSLIELLVVIVIIGLLSTVVVITMADPRGRIAGDADRFAGRVKAARDAAIITGRPMALWVSPTGYGFQRREDGQWRAVDEGPLAASDWSSTTNARFSGVSQLRTVFDSVGRADQALDFSLVRDEQTMRVRVSLSGVVTSGD